MYVADTGNDRIQMLDERRQPMTYFGKRCDNSGLFKNPRGIGLDRTGTFGRALGAQAKPPMNCKIPSGIREINSAIYDLYVPDYNKPGSNFPRQGACIGAFGS